jgi:hypothetical protein
MNDHFTVSFVASYFTPGRAVDRPSTATRPLLRNDLLAYSY